jgi:glycogen operon protein
MVVHIGEGHTAAPLAPGDAAVLGARPGEGGCFFSLYSAEAEAVELCLFSADGGSEIARHALVEREGDVWHGFLPGAGAGTCYGYRVHGPWAPEAGLRFNAHKLVLDPYARDLRGAFRWDESHFAYERAACARGDGNADLSFSRSDNSAFLPKAVVCEPWPAAADHRPLTPRAESWIYELHLAGFTRQHPDIPRELRGSCAGLTHAASLDYLRSLGVTALELLPVHAFIDEHALHRRGLRNYWGYNTLAFFVPHPAYTGAGGPTAFRDMVRRCHDAGLEVILDVVFNHSAESDELGPQLSLRGIDNRNYYRLREDAPRYYVNDTGCGNTLNTGHPAVRRLIVDALRYWAREMQVDGFRFDLAPVLGRETGPYRMDAALLQAINTDPVLRRCKLIGEPWDIGPEGYQLGQLPGGWSEWNDRYRDCLRRFWRGDAGVLPELGRRLTGSADLFSRAAPAPTASVNYVCSHDGFTLRDLVSYAERHNLANGEDNRDGHAENLSDNLGVEGPSDEPTIDARRWQRQRNLLATLALSQGLPMLQAGDEFGRSQSGNNNAYCQDNALTWIDWSGISTRGAALRELTRRLIALRLSHPLLRADRYRHETPDIDGQCIRWYNARGEPAGPDDWEDPERRDILCALLELDPEGNVADALLLALNAGPDARHYRLPDSLPRPRVRFLDSAEPEPGEVVQAPEPIDSLSLAPESLQIVLAGSGAARHTGDADPGSTRDRGAMA